MSNNSTDDPSKGLVNYMKDLKIILEGLPIDIKALFHLLKQIDLDKYELELDFKELDLPKPTILKIEILSYYYRYLLDKCRYSTNFNIEVFTKFYYDTLVPYYSDEVLSDYYLTEYNYQILHHEYIKLAIKYKVEIQNNSISEFINNNYGFSKTNIELIRDIEVIRKRYLALESNKNRLTKTLTKHLDIDSLKKILYLRDGYSHIVKSCGSKYTAHNLLSIMFNYHYIPSKIFNNLDLPIRGKHEFLSFLKSFYNNNVEDIRKLYLDNEIVDTKECSSKTNLFSIKGDK